jgi:hypothetical protein
MSGTLPGVGAASCRRRWGFDLPHQSRADRISLGQGRRLSSTAPFGVGFVIGAGGNLLMANGIIKTAKTMFDAADDLKAADRDV